jgi:DNA-binding LacI/PurR family transcriptional regulator
MLPTLAACDVIHNSLGDGVAERENITMSRLAEKLGVSAMTVSRALNAKEPPARPDALKSYMEIRDMADRLGYRKSPAPRAMVTGRSNTVSILGGGNWRMIHLPESRLRGITDAAEELGLSVSLTRMDERSLADPAFIPGMLASRSSDGFLISQIAGLCKSSAGRWTRSAPARRKG